jgi:anti-sigma B factor antagonist
LAFCSKKNHLPLSNFRRVKRLYGSGGQASRFQTRYESPPIGSGEIAMFLIASDDAEPEGVTMLSLRIQKLGDATVVRCAGRMVLPYVATLRNAILRERRIRTLVLDLADIIAIDAAGLGMLASLRARTKETRTALKLMNVSPRVEELLELTNLKSAFDVCSGREMLALLCRAINETESVGFKTVIQDANRIEEALGNGSVVMAGEALGTD